MNSMTFDDAQRFGVRADLVQLEILLKLAIDKLSASFSGAQTALRQQQAIAADPASAALAQVACSHLDSALTALQFEDIASQLIGSARLQLYDLQDDPSIGQNVRIPQHHMESGEIEMF